MEEHLRPPQNSDPECRSELTRTVSNAAASSSAVAPGTRAYAAPGSSTKWTNEKHRLYIHSLESSFVNKLNHSMRSWGCHPQNNVQGPHSTQELPFKTYKSSDQFMVVREKSNFPRNETLLESTADSHVTLPSPGICHFTAAGTKFNVASPNLQAHTLSSNNRTHPRRNKTSKESSVTARISGHNPACHQYSVGGTTEVLGQNFADENHRGKISCEFIPKRLKRASEDVSSTDQIVPLRNEKAHNTLPIGEQARHHLLLEHHPDTLICPKSIFTCS